jgi:hypothetical protein
VFASGVCAKTADQRKDAGEMGAGQGQAESSGGSAGSAGAPVSGLAGAAGKGGGWLMRWDCEEHIESENENCEEKIPTHAASKWSTRLVKPCVQNEGFDQRRPL